VIFLFSQIAISLLLAGVVGITIGWLAHRARADKHIHQLQQVVGRQQQHVNEAQTEVSILTGDFDDLKYRTDNQINELKLESQKIPALNQNLEKSQLLVRQLMQKHTAELTELSEEKEKLLAKSKIANDREKELTKLQAELDIERRKTRKIDADADVSSAKSQTELPLNIHDDAPKKMPLSGNKPKASPSIASPSNDAATIANAAIASASIPSAAQTEAELKELRAQLAEDVSVKPVPNKAAQSKITESEITESKITESKITQGKINESKSTKNISADSGTANSQPDDGELEPLFDMVDQHDDLKQIFGIGPVTEKTLNKLGITAYSQLAELKQHDIEKIANALQIIPSRIERDNWVGGARAQLEEVLEGL